MAAGHKIAVATVLANINLVVWYVIAIHIHVYTSKKIFADLDLAVAKLLNLIFYLKFQLYGKIYTGGCVIIL